VKIAFIVQRYGSEVLGGSEHLCRLLAERLAPLHEVEVLTTCARDYITWKNEYAEGSDRIRGVTVRRFASTRTRDLDAFNKYSEWIYNNPHTREDEIEWLRQQGPWCPSLIEYLGGHHRQFDVLVFFTYLYSLTVLGLEIEPARSVLVSTAHDEPAIQLGIFREVFRRPAAICYLTESERRFVHRQFPERPLLEDVIGVGVDLPQQRPYPRMPPPDDESSDGTGTREAQDSSADGAGRPDWSTDLAGRGVVFRRRHRMEGPILLYGGRIDPGKGCEELIEYFSTFVERGGQATLVLMGAKLMSLPEVPYVRFAGLLSDSERLEALEAATIVACPSPYESLSLLALESMAAGTPVLANARSAVLAEHCLRSNAGLFYEDRDEFLECLTLLLGDARLRASMGQNGREYIRRQYRWDVVLGKYERLFGRVRSVR
jgi:glycosyltransferase involved in cell wall biosynthesis